MSDRAEFAPRPAVPAAATRPDRTLVAIILLAIMALAGTIALLPGTEEKAEGLLADGRYGDAIETLVAVEHERPLDAYESYMLFKLYLLTKQADSAAALLAQQPALQADYASALRQLSALYRADGDLAGEAEALRKLYAIGGNEDDFARLRVLYRLTGDRASEAALLAEAIAAGRATPLQRQRLAYLRAAPADGIPTATWAATTGRFAKLAAFPTPTLE